MQGTAGQKPAARRGTTGHLDDYVPDQDRLVDVDYLYNEPYLLDEHVHAYLLETADEPHMLHEYETAYLTLDTAGGRDSSAGRASG